MFGVLGMVAVLVVIAYVIRSVVINSNMYKMNKTEKPSIGFDNALFSRNQDTVSLASS